MNTVAWLGIVSSVIFLVVVICDDIQKKKSKLYRLVGAISGISQILCGIAIVAVSITNIYVVISTLIVYSATYLSNDRKQKAIKSNDLQKLFIDTEVYPKSKTDYLFIYVSIALGTLPFIAYILTNSH